MNTQPIAQPHGIKKDLMIFIGFILLTVSIAVINLGRPRLILTLPLLVVEAGLITYYFSHLIGHRKSVFLLLLLTLILVGSLLFWPGWDYSYSTRNMPVFD
jgi:hypothetical protein